jgi:glycosyltransferase involved in cell wall biosynthesis
MPASTVSHAPLVSIVMPVYDPHPVRFREAVDSILRQTMSDWELLIVEDPSPRSAAELLADVDDPRIRHLQRRDKGTLVESLNWGLAESLAPLVARADADDVCEPDRLEKQLAYLQEHPEVDVLGSQLAIIDDEGKPRGYRGYPLHHEAIARGMAISNAVAHPSVLFKKQSVLAAGGYRSFFSEDYELWSRLLHRQAHFANYPEALVRYRVIPQGTREAKVRNTLRETLEIKELYWRDQMGLRGILRMWAERVMLWLPPRFVLHLFLKTQHRSGLSAYTKRLEHGLTTDVLPDIGITS